METRIVMNKNSKIVLVIALVFQIITVVVGAFTYNLRTIWYLCRL